jgi:hypothetical protein
MIYGTSLAYGMDSTRLRDILESNTEDGSIYPEKRLWTAIILFALVEYEDILKHIQKLWTSNKKPVSRHFHTQLRMLRYEIEHSWFQNICDIADQPHVSVLGKLKHLEDTYGLKSVNFSNDDTRITRYQIRKNKLLQ